jgi:2-methylcitrate dehydratase PrpD
MKSIALTNLLTEHCLKLGKEVPLDTDLKIASHCLLDWISVGRAGWNETATQILYGEILIEGGNPQATLLNGSKATAMQASILNGTASHVLDFDDVHLQSRVHPSTPLWSAILAESEVLMVSGIKVFQAFIAGVEMQSRIAFAMGEDHYNQGWHNTATLGCFGAATAIAVMHGLNANQLQQALGICATQAAGMRTAFGTMCKPLHVGRAAAIGMQSARLAKKGFTAPLDTLEMPQGFFELYAHHHNLSNALQNLENPCFRNIIFKYNASCYGTQAPIEACKRLVQDHNLAPQDIERIDIEIEMQYMSVCCIQQPKSSAEAKFSIAYMCALALSKLSTVSPESFDKSWLANKGLIDLCAKTYIEGKKEIPRANAQVRILLNNGQKYSFLYNANLPELDLNNQEAKITSKANALLTSDMTEDQATILIGNALTMFEEKNSSKLLKSLTSL